MVSVPPQQLNKLREAGAFRPGGRKVLQKQGYSQQEANAIYEQNVREGKVYGRRSAGISPNGIQMTVTEGTIEAQQLEPVTVTDTSAGSITRKYAKTGEVTSTTVTVPKQIKSVNEFITKQIRQSNNEPPLVAQRNANEIYTRGIGYTSTPLNREQATVTARQPTPDELAVINSAQYRGDLMSKSASEIITTTRQYNKLLEGYDSLSQEEQQKVVDKIVKLGGRVNPTTGVIEAPTVEIGIGANKREVAITDLDTRNKGQLYKSVVANIAQTAVEKNAKKILGNEGVTTVTTSTPLTGQVTRGTISGSLEEQPLFFKTTKKEFITAEQLGKTAGTVVSIAPYFTPVVGESIFYGEQAYNVGSKITETGSTKQGVLSYVKEFPIEAGTTATLGALRITGMTAKAITPELKVTRTTEEIASKSPAIFIKPTMIKRVITPEGQTVEQASFEMVGKAKRGASISNVVVTEQSPLSELFGFKPKEIYNSAEAGNRYGLLFPGKIYRDSNLLSRYNRAFNEIVAVETKKGIAQGLDKAVAKKQAENLARKNLRAYNPSPANIGITGKGSVLIGSGDKDLVKAFGEAIYEPIQVTPKGSNRLTRLFQPFKEKSSTSGFSVVERDGVQYYLVGSDVNKVYFPLGQSTQEFQKLSQIGKTTTKTEQLSGIKEFNIPDYSLVVNGVEKPFQIFQESSLVKQIAPVKRTVTQTKSTLFLEKTEPSIIEYGQPFKSETIIKPTAPKPITTFTEQQGQELVKTLKSIYGEDKLLEAAKKVASTLPKPTLGFTKAPASSITTIKPSTSVPVIKSINVGQGAYFGKGLYERTTTDVVSMGNIKPVTDTSIVPDIKTNVITKLEPNTRFDLGTASSFEFKDSTRDVPLIRIDTSVKSAEKTDTTIKVVPQLKEKTKQTTALKVGQYQFQTRPKKTVITPPVNIKIPYIPKTSTKTKEQQLEELNELFKVYARKFGKDVLLGEVRTKGAAKKLLEKELVGTLRASGFVTRASGQRLKVSELGFGKGFTRSKRDISRVVQQRGYRLGSFGERQEIKSARKFRI